MPAAVQKRTHIDHWMQQRRVEESIRLDHGATRVRKCLRRTVPDFFVDVLRRMGRTEDFQHLPWFATVQSPRGDPFFLKFLTLRGLTLVACSQKKAALSVALHMVTFELATAVLLVTKTYVLPSRLEHCLDRFLRFP